MSPLNTSVTQPCNISNDSLDIAVSVEGLWKQYRYGAISHATLRKDIQSWWARVRSRPDPNLPIDSGRLAKNGVGEADDRFWALRDVSFDVKRGEVLGIIGRNGAGKSTLLKIMSRVTTPTKGEIRIKGRIASLLEVGTGFHPELTGGENIYLNGAILGMTKDEIRRKFDEIVAFAEVEKFVDTPVKRYSSGMYVRLAFAVAAHLEPEILVIDEVLAVGDAQFQKKCLGKLANVAKEGRTVLFVSHNLSAVNKLCKNVICLTNGQIFLKGSKDKVIKDYLNMFNQDTGQACWQELQSAPGNRSIRLKAVRILDGNGKVSTRLDIQKAFYVEIEYDIYDSLPKLRTGFSLMTADGVTVFTSSDSADASWDDKLRTPGKYISRCEIPANLLNEGSYVITNIAADIPFVEILFLEEASLPFCIEKTGGVSGKFPEKWAGVICPELKWNINLSARQD